MPRYLRQPVGNEVLRREATTHEEPETHCRIEMGAGHMAECISPGQHRQPECERHASIPDADGWNARGQYRRTASTENEPECANEFSRQSVRHVHDVPPLAPIQAL